MNEDEFLKGIKQSIEDLLVLYKLEYNYIKPQVDYVLNNNIKNIIYIEDLLEKLLNIPYEPCYVLFVNLCNYVSTFNYEIAQDYIALYNEIYGENEIENKR